MRTIAAPRVATFDLRARIVNDAESDPEPASEYPWHHQSLPSTMRGRKRCCSTLPKPMITGASILTPKASCVGALARAHSVSNKYCAVFPQAVPQNVGGHAGAPEPRSLKMRCHRDIARHALAVSATPTR